MDLDSFETHFETFVRTCFQANVMRVMLLGLLNKTNESLKCITLFLKPFCPSSNQQIAYVYIANITIK